MGTLRPPIPAKLFVGMITNEEALFAACTQQLAVRYGPADLQSAALPWDHSDYYRTEMGTGLLRVFVFFERLIDPGALADIKRSTVLMEQGLSRPGTSGAHRRMNLDPGYLTEAKVVLATTKDFPHRIYVGNSVYAESTLHYAKHLRSFQAVGHTYPDFRSDTSLELFNRARDLLRKALAQQEGR